MIQIHNIFRSLNKVEKNKENQRKVPPAPLRLSRPKTATSKTKKVNIVIESLSEKLIEKK